jgi:hypothetical protein
LFVVVRGAKLSNPFFITEHYNKHTTQNYNNMKTFKDLVFKTSSDEEDFFSELNFENGYGGRVFLDGYDSRGLYWHVFQLKDKHLNHDMLGRYGLSKEDITEFMIKTQKL